MPYVEVTSSARLLDKDRQQDLLRNVTRLTAEHLGKPEAYVMVRFQQDASMAFAGTTEACACVEVRGIGAPTPEQTAGLNQALCQELESSLGLTPSRTFVIFTAVSRELWGLSGRMLG